MYELKEIIYYLRKFDLDEKSIKKCYEMIPDPAGKVESQDKLFIECQTQYHINTIGSFIENITRGIEKGYITEAIKKTAREFSYVREIPRIAFYVVVLSKVVK
ncbi:hypothetical protein FJR48_04115 [Sulfurimonas lithotrophica]|uniref:Uncharacterized protein n=1 Tax=Sulfurimonas lithotrophica TaxID=2590022 RepID=A0A5P8NZS2_9BACT|nr:hypothetical protein [Sulfurimonas lithotrophica]QFR48948.1 hypothetical protein FJR48_04115 [Sulfurimonas lithotrophica]